MLFQLERYFVSRIFAHKQILDLLHRHVVVQGRLQYVYQLFAVEVRPDGSTLQSTPPPFAVLRLVRMSNSAKSFRNRLCALQITILLS